MHDRAWSAQPDRRLEVPESWDQISRICRRRWRSGPFLAGGRWRRTGNATVASAATVSPAGCRGIDVCSLSSGTMTGGRPSALPTWMHVHPSGSSGSGSAGVQQLLPPVAALSATQQQHGPPGPAVAVSPWQWKAPCHGMNASSIDAASVSMNSRFRVRRCTTSCYVLSARTQQAAAFFSGRPAGIDAKDRSCSCILPT